MRLLTALAAGIAAVLSGPAAAQFGDTSLAYKDGVVYDDDLVPGYGLNAPFAVEEQTSPAPMTRERIPRSSPDLLDTRTFQRVEDEAAQRAFERRTGR